MGKHYLLGLLAVAAALAVMLAVAIHLSKPVGITQAACDRIQHGMTQRQVEAILGAPPGDYRTWKGVVIVLDGGGSSMREGRQETWWGDEGRIEIGFDLDHTVLWKQFTDDGGWGSSEGVVRRQSSFSQWWRRWWDRLAP